MNYLMEEALNVAKWEQPMLWTARQRYINKNIQNEFKSRFTSFHYEKNSDGEIIIKKGDIVIPVVAVQSRLLLLLWSTIHNPFQILKHQRWWSKIYDFFFQKKR